MSQDKFLGFSFNSVKNFFDRLSRLSRTNKRALMLGLDTVCIPLALICAFMLDVGRLPSLPVLVVLSVTALVVTLPIFVRLGLYRAVIRYIGSYAVKTIFLGVSMSVFIFALIAFAVPSLGIELALLAIYWLVAVIYVMGSRFVARGILQSYKMSMTEPVLIYGAGAAGTALVWSLQRHGTYSPVAFIDDDQSLHKANMAGLDVYPPSKIKYLVQDFGVRTLLLAMPSATHRRRNGIIRQLESLNVKVQTVPDYAEIVSGNVVINDFRDVDANDLLGRDPVASDPQLMAASVSGKVVLVTGAGGSIGSELCRQIVKLNPACLVLLEMSEVALFAIERELAQITEQINLKLEIVPLLGNAQHLERIKVIMSTYHIQTVYHAAAYKHVPLVEQNIVRGLQNNVITTWHLAEAAIASKVEVFVLISTDKAVNPTNVMGATKRMAELILQGMQQSNVSTKFCMVRFGNVLESSGSVVPLFREQIKGGGPVTVTHRDIVRYFMTIPEAVQLVIQAGSMATGGDVFVLDMGEPVRIYDLAKRMIKLMGSTVRDEQTPQGDIEIVFTGLRPGEKLYEELLIGENVVGTQHPMIMRAMEHSHAWADMQHYLERAQNIVEGFDSEEARQVLIDCVGEYQPEKTLHDLVLSRQRESNPPRKVSDFRVVS